MPAVVGTECKLTERLRSRPGGVRLVGLWRRIVAPRRQSADLPAAILLNAFRRGGEDAMSCSVHSGYWHRSLVLSTLPQQESRTTRENQGANHASPDFNLSFTPVDPCRGVGTGSRLRQTLFPLVWTTLHPICISRILPTTRAGRHSLPSPASSPA